MEFKLKKVRAGSTAPSAPPVTSPPATEITSPPRQRLSSQLEQFRSQWYTTQKVATKSQQAAAQFEEQEMYGTKDNFKIDSHSSQPLRKPVQRSKTSSPAGAFSDTPRRQLSPANKDLSNLKYTTRSGLDEAGASEPLTTSDESHAKEKNHDMPLDNIGGAAATPFTPPGPWEASKLRHRIKTLEFEAEQLETRRREAVNEGEKQQLQTMALSLQIKIRGKWRLLKECEARGSSAYGSGDGRYYGMGSPYTTQDDQQPQMPRPLQEYPPSQRPPMDPSRSMRRQIQHEPSSLPAPAQVEHSGPEPQESPEDEWTDIKLEEAVVPLGQEEWDDDLAPELAPAAASNHSQYPRVGRNSVNEMLIWRRY
ncbi:hypothetical protein Daus18300_005412 [Diaporthe australafricana]|uniref:Uncharacterized protein n=1 Tax=Diaporthe australafricana TaxID=127596 RepID=A0ABR3X2L1_9PEZI